MIKNWMKKMFGLCLVAFLIMAQKPVAQETYRESILEYIQTYAPLAIREMNRTGFPASIKIAQGIHESGAGKSQLVKKSNNHFGLKCKSNWTGGKVYHDDDERGECFRQYQQAEESYADHSDYLKSQERYASLFELDPNDYEGWSWGLKKAGYATSPVYAQTLIKYIENYQLNLLNDYATGDEEDEIDLSSYFTALNEQRSEIPGSKTSMSSGPSIDEENNVLKDVEKKNSNTHDANKKSASHLKSSKNKENTVFKINGLKVMEVEKGTSLLALARQNKLQLSSLIAFNDLPSNTTNLKENQLIFLQAKKKTGKNNFHKVRRGETLYEISQLEGIKLSSLRQLNKLKKGMEPKVGQQLNLKSTAKKRPLLSKK
jgi:LysM repeat protein